MVITFRVLKHDDHIPTSAAATCYLLEDNWDDQFKFSTMYFCVLFDQKGARMEIGQVKIGQFSMPHGQRRPSIPSQFVELPEGYFSLGQDVSYYSIVMKLGADTSTHFFEALRDLVADPPLLERALKEQVTQTSLLRSVTEQTIKTQFRRVIEGGAPLTPYRFVYQLPKRGPAGSPPPPALEFHVRPGSSPPTNIHVLIGRNGVGKTFILNKMARSLLSEEKDARKDGKFEPVSDEVFETSELFANLVSVTFSAFDSFQKLKEQAGETDGIGYTYIGLKRSPGNSAADTTKSSYMLGTEFANSAWGCTRKPRRKRWEKAIAMLSTEPGFGNERVAELFAQENDTWDEIVFKKAARRLFNSLSAGHKIVVLTMTRLIEAVAEKTLVLVDEPEAHLHPPLLSAFLRSLSDLLVDRNGVAIVATHSPVVLQEVPKSCVWKVRRYGTEVVAERTAIETFGENVGILTREAFGLELTQAGYHGMLTDAVARGGDYATVVNEFGGALGGEAKAITQALIVNRDA